MSKDNHKSPVISNAGVYMIFDPNTRAAYVGASRNLIVRVNFQLAAARRPGGLDFYGEFEASNPEDIQVCILEYIHDQPERTGRERDRRCGLQSGPLRDRERYWIQKLQPSANRMHKKIAKPAIESLEELAIGIPEGFQPLAA